MSCPSSKQQRGLTLIEVLIALAILAIAMMAAIKAVSTDIRGEQHLQEKTMALWVGEQVMNEALVGVIALPSHEALQQETRLLGRTWYWVLSHTLTSNPHIRELTVRVYTHLDEETETSPLLQLTSYLYVANDQQHAQAGR